MIKANTPVVALTLSYDCNVNAMWSLLALSKVFWHPQPHFVSVTWLFFILYHAHTHYTACIKYHIKVYFSYQKSIRPTKARKKGKTRLWRIEEKPSWRIRSKFVSAAAQSLSTTFKFLFRNIWDPCYEKYLQGSLICRKLSCFKLWRSS